MTKRLSALITGATLFFCATSMAQKVGINKNNPTEVLDVNGNAKADTLKAQVIKITTNAGANKVLMSDANGNGTWTNPPSGGGGTLDAAYNYGGAGAGKTIAANSGAVQINGNDGLIITGTNGLGSNLSVSGMGTRMFFYPKKSAFRAGYVNATNWDDANIGEQSCALGFSSLATGSASMAWGQASQALSTYSTACGSYTIASAPYSFAGGNSCTATGSASFAIGSYNNAKGYYSTALGNFTTANGNGSLTIGTYNDTITAVSQSFNFSPTTPLFIIGNGTMAAPSNAMVVKYSGNVGLGTNNPSSRLEVNANTGAVLINGTDGFQVTGTYNTGTDLALSGQGTRMFFYPKKAAFRAGYVTVNNWNKDSIGGYSFAGGYNPIAKGTYSIALGTSANASGENAMALGYAPLASGISTVAIGYLSKATANNSIAIGNYSEAKTTYATAIGYSAIASGTYSVAIGNGTATLGESSFAAGLGTRANGFASTAMGSNSLASGSYATALGNNGTASADNSFAAGTFAEATGTAAISLGDNVVASGASSSCFGKENFAAAYNSFVIGRFNDSIAGVTAGSWVATDPLFIIGNGSSAAVRSNAFVLYKNGNAEIGGNFTPNLGNTYSLGKNNKKWTEVWATNGTIQTSDARLKKNIANLNYGLETVMQMRPVSYLWKDGTGGNQIGFIAQEIMQIIPEAVVKTSDAEPLGMKYAELIPVLTKAIQEQQSLIEKLQIEIEKLKQKAN